MKGKFTATVIGLIFCVACLLTTSTFIVPFITILPIGAALESLYSSMYGEVTYSVTGGSVLITLLLLCLLLIVFFFRYFIKKLRQHQLVSIKSFILFLSLQLFIVHPLVFYIHTSQDWSKASDGQFILGIIDTFPLSSIVFLLFGIALDVVRYYWEFNSSKPAENSI